MIKEALTRAEGALNVHSRFSVEIFRDCILFDSQEVFRIDKAEGNYIQEMYLDGVRKLTFDGALPYEELRTLLSVLARDIQKYESKEDDSVTLLWKSDLKHIRFEAVDVYQSDTNAFLRQMAIIEEWEDLQEDEENFMLQFIQSLLGFKASDAKPVKHQTFHPELMKQPLPEWVADPMKQPSQDALAEDASALAKASFFDEGQKLLCEILEYQTDPEKLASLCATATQTISKLIEDRQLPTAILWLKGLRSTQEFLRAVDGSFAMITDTPLVDILENQFKKLSEPEFFTNLESVYLDDLSAKTSVWRELFKLLGPHSVEAACECLKWISQETLLSEWCVFLSELFPEEAPRFQKLLTPDNPKLSRAIFRIIGASANPHLLADWMRPFFFHDDPELRRELLRLGEKLPIASLKPLVQKALRDAEESIRLMALRYVKLSDDVFYAQALQDEIKKTSFSSKTPQEQKLFLTLLCKLEGKKSLHTLAQILQDKTLPQEMRLLTLQILSKLPFPEIPLILGELAKKTWADRALALAAKEALGKR